MPDPQNKDWFSQFEEDKGKDYFSQFEEVPKSPEVKEEPSLLSRAVEYGKEKLAQGEQFVGEHPNLRRFLMGPSEEELGGAKLNAPSLYPGEIPGLRSAIGSAIPESYPTIKKYGPGVLAGIVEGAFDPSNAAIKKIPIPEVPLKETVPDIPVPSPTRQRLLPQGQYNVSPFGEAGVPLNEGFEQASSPLTLTSRKQKLLGEGSRFIASPEGEVSDIAVPLEEPPIRHEPTNAEGQVTVKEDAKLEPQIKEAEIVSEVPKPEVLKTPNKELPPNQRALMYRGANDRVEIRFPDSDSRELFGSGARLKDRPGGLQRFQDATSRVVSRFGLDEQSARRAILDYNSHIKELGNAQPKFGEDLKFEAPSFSDFIGGKEEVIPEVKLRGPAQEYIDGIKSGSIDKGTSYTDYLSGKANTVKGLAQRLVKEESGEFSPFKMFKKIRGVDDAEANKVRESIVNLLIQGGRLDLEGIYGKTVGMNRNQFNKIVDEIIDTGAASKIAEQIKINTPQPIQRLLGALADSKINSALQAAQLSTERGQRFGAFSSVLAKGEGKEGFRKAASQMAGEYGKVSPVEFKLGQADTDALYNQIKNNTRITPAEKLRAGFALRDLLEGNRVLQRNELQLMDRIYGPGIGNQIMELHGGLGGVPFKLAKTANTMKSMNATFDLSAPFRQGLGLVHRREYWTAFGQMFKYAKSEEAFQALEKSMEAHPNYLLSRDAGLFTADHSIGNFEEAWMDSYLNDIHKAIGEKNTAKYSPARASERAYVGFLNKLRFDTFNTLLENADKAGLKTFNMKEGIKIPTDLTNQIAKYVNTATGRGDLGSLSKYADGLNNILFSPRLIASRLTILNPMYYVNANPFVRKEALKTLLALGSFTGTVGAIGSVMGGETKLTPSAKNLTNPDFGKLKFGKTRLDPGGGLNQYIVAANQFVQGKATSSTSGRTYDLAGPRTMYAGQKPVFGQQSVGGKIGGVFQQNPSFLENKFSPMASLIDTLLTGRSNASGQPINIKTEIAKKFTPLIMQDLYDLYQEDPKLLGLGVPAAFGMGLQTYQEREPSMGMSAPKMNLNLRP